MKITVVGIGYVGLSLATLLSKDNDVCMLDIIKEKVDLVNNRISPIADPYIDYYFKNVNLNLCATKDNTEAFKEAEYIIICIPSDYDEKSNSLDTSNIDDIVKKIININKNATIIIKSTVPIGYTESIKEKYRTNNIIFSPEFLREGSALYDNLYPSRIVIGEKSKRAELFAQLLLKCAKKDDIKVLYTNNTEAEAIKLFSNAYLALRVSFFNELDTFAEVNGLNTKDIINGIALDPRIGNYYNNPSFGYGGNCLEKDTKQLIKNYRDIKDHVIKSIIESNNDRKEHIANTVINRKPKTIGIYRLISKANTDSIRHSAIQDIINKLKDKANVIIYEPMHETDTYNGCKVENDFDLFVNESDIILTNRYEDKLEKVKNKVYTKDLYNRD